MDEFVIAQTNLFIKRGDTKPYTIYFEDEDGMDINITGWTIFFTAKINIDDSDDDAKIKKTIISHTDPINGETQILLTSTDTADVGNYVYDIQYKDTAGNIRTVMEGMLVIAQDITQRTS
jgi:hypothetical protein